MSGSERTRDTRIIELIVDEDVDALARLIKARAFDPTAPLVTREPPLRLAARWGRERMVALLLANGADPNVYEPDDGSALMASCQVNHPGVARRLIAAGAEVDAQDRYGLTALHWAIARQAPEVAKVLITAGAAVNAQHKDGGTPLHVAAECAVEPALVRLLLQAGADPTLRDGAGRTPADLAEQEGRTELARLLRAAAVRQVACRDTDNAAQHVPCL